MHANTLKLLFPKQEKNDITGSMWISHLLKALLINELVKYWVIFIIIRSPSTPSQIIHIQKIAKGIQPLGVQGSAITADTAWDDCTPLQSLGRQGLPHRATEADGSVGCVWLWWGGQRLLRAAGRPLPLVVVAAEGELVFEGAAVAAASFVFGYRHPIELRTAPADRQEGHFVREASVSCVYDLKAAAFEITHDANVEQNQRNKWCHTTTYLRGVASSCGGMITTRTDTEVLRRSIICSCVSVATATLQISTNLLPWRSPACQA